VIYWAPFGDTILATPLIRRLSGAFAGSRITYIANYPLYTPFGPPSMIIEGNPYVRQVITSHKMLLAELLRQEPYDLAVDLVGNSFTGMLAYLSGAGYKVCAKFRGEPYSIYWVSRRPDGSWSDKTVCRIPPEKKLCRVEHLLEIARTMGIAPGKDIRPRIYLSREESASGRRKIKGLTGGRRPVIAIQPGGHHKDRLWDWRNYSSLCDRLSGQMGARVLVIEGPREAATVRKMLSGCRHAPAVLRPADLREFFALVSQCDLFISTDGGPLHMSLALGTPAVGIFKSRTIMQYWYLPHYRRLLSPAYFHPSAFRSRDGSKVDTVFRRAGRLLRQKKLIR